MLVPLLEKGWHECNYIKYTLLKNLLISCRIASLLMLHCAAL
jgi:hypothetical protein